MCEGIAIRLLLHGNGTKVNKRVEDMKYIIIFAGIGWASVIIVQFLNIYYIVILGWALFYMFASFSSELPWSRCGNEWNTPNCIDVFTATEKTNITINATMMPNMSTVPTAIATAAKVSASEEYWE